ncbi:unnamed protein product [Brassicogethes aeneus]|uniref:DUF4371 domain-containing protein n=1 Tax=Brassicogethes aeneus TaxID=1431903 RepID=A0A9P0FDE8_BRAAE|nr:unnamed protein product [Brassicogethes aeneus]
MERKKERSGASKRKQRQEREACEKKLPKLDSFFTKTLCATVPSAAEISAKSDKCLFTASVDTAVSVNEVTLEDQEYQDSTILINATAENDYVDASVQPTVDESSISTASEVFEISTDLGKFINKKLNDTEKRLILDKGPLKPPGPFPKDLHQDHRIFSETVWAPNLNIILDQIRASPFFTIIMDTTQDISKADQLSIVVRYAVIVRSENGQPIDIEVVFFGFHAGRSLQSNHF